MNDVLKNVSEWLLSVVTTVIITGGAGMLIYKHFFLDKKQKQDAQLQKQDAQTKLMDTLQKMAFDSMDKINTLQKDVDYWRREYHELGKSTTDLQKNYELALHENESLKKSIDKLTRQYQELKKQYDQLTKTL